MCGGREKARGPHAFSEVMSGRGDDYREGRRRASAGSSPVWRIAIPTDLAWCHSGRKTRGKKDPSWARFPSLVSAEYV